MKLGLASWHRYMLGNDPALLDDLIADDAVFHSPVVHTPQAGRAKVLMYLTAAGQVFGNGTFRYVRELTDGPEACLEFECEMDGIAVNGIDLMVPHPYGPMVHTSGIGMDAITELMGLQLHVETAIKHGTSMGINIEQMGLQLYMQTVINIGTLMASVIETVVLQLNKKLGMRNGGLKVNVIE